MARELKAVLDEANPNKLASAAQVAKLGSALGCVPAFAKGTVTSHVLTLPEGARARAILAAFASAGTSAGEKAPQLQGTAVAAGEAGINAAGNVLFNATDAITEAEVLYLPVQGEIIEETLDVDSDVAALPSERGAVLLLEAEALTGTLTGVFVPEHRAVTPGTGEAAITEDGLGIEFAAADAVTSARVKYVATPGQGSEGAALTARLAADTAL